VVIAVAVADPTEVTELSDSSRGAGGFGSSGR
jgi:dUTPase